DKYDYSKTVYVRDKDKATITCKVHGDFEQTPRNHLSGQGCAKCAGRHIYSTREWVQEAIGVHGDLYDYGRVVYVRSSDKIIITCKQHGDFEQSPNDHLRGKGCAKCSGVHRYSTREWIQEAVAVHGDRYDYGCVVYVRNSDKVIITCKNHGDFEQQPTHHLSGSGCPSCPKRFDQPTNLYLMHNGLGKVKVGYSIDVDARITELNRESPFEAELLESWTLPDTPTVRKIESKVHRKLAKYHAGLSGFDGATEWFNTSPERAKKEINAILSKYAILNHTIANQPQLSLF
ncbi:MAG TPA: GIY-YIG nuclease family protein, partial [Pseudomonadales bacterium]|nr:GIY-YIG nuclease family protein [Pseudomonadales bacterium]